MVPLRAIRNSLLSIRATVLLAPRLLAMAHDVMLFVSNGVTAMNRSVSETPTSFRLEKEYVLPFQVMRL